MQNIMLNLSAFWRCGTDEGEHRLGYLAIFEKAHADDIPEFPDPFWSCEGRQKHLS
jgi:hypothetical protein